MLKELVSQYGDFEDGSVVPELDMMRRFEAKRVTRRLGYDAWRGFVHGTKFTLTMADAISRDTRAFLFSQVLNHVLPQFASVNSFSELEVQRINAKGISKLWQPRSGNKALA
jgi:type VI secretion system protein ImpG